MSGFQRRKPYVLLQDLRSIKRRSKTKNLNPVACVAQQGQSFVEELTPLVNFNVTRPPISKEFVLKKDLSVEKKYVGFSFTEKLDLWSLEFHISENALTALLKFVLKDYEEKVLPKVPSTAAGIRQKAKNLEFTPNGSGRQFVKSLKETLRKQLDKYPLAMIPDKIDLDLGSDGMPPTSSHNFQLWPLVLRIRNLLPSTPFMHSCYGGKFKPNTNQLLTPLLSQIESFKTEPFLYKNKKMTVRVRKLKGDLPATSEMLGVKGHSGYFSCRKCKIKGTYSTQFKKIIFKRRHPRKRTDKEFRQVQRTLPQDSGTLTNDQKKKMHNIRKSVLTSLENFDLVNDTPYDSMHLILLGAVKILIGKWVNGKGTKLSQRELNIVCKKLKRLSSFFPCEFNRFCPPLSDFQYFKATEFKNFLLYGFLSVRHLFPEEISSNFLHLHCAVRIMSDPTLYKDHLNIAAILIEKFFYKAGKIYGDGVYTLNFHNLLHVPEDLSNLDCPLFEESCFDLENFLYSLKKTIKFGPDPLVQACARDIEIDKIKKKYFIQPKVPILYHKKKVGGKSFYGSLSFNNFTLLKTIKKIVTI